MEPGFDRESVNQWSHRDLVDQVVAMAEDADRVVEMSRKLRDIRMVCDAYALRYHVPLNDLYPILNGGEYLT